jgi:hypothetical protein
LGGGLAALCGVNAGANTSANPVGASAAPFGLYNEERGLPAAEPATRQNPETSVHILKARPWLAALEDYQLLPEAQIVCDQQRLWLDSRSKRP